MAESKKVVIKINYDKNVSHLSIKPPSTVIIWHKKRVVLALVLLVILFSSCVYWLRGLQESKQNGVAPSSALSRQSEIDEKIHTATADTEVLISPNMNPLAVHSPTAVYEKTEPGSLEKKREFAIIFDKAVVRASLNSALKDNEPNVLVTSPIKLTDNQSVELFYFTELKGIKHKIFYHYWSKDGKLVYKKQLDVKKKQLKVNSARILSNKDKGNWQIQLVDKTGKIFSEVNFIVYTE